MSGLQAKARLLPFFSHHNDAGSNKHQTKFYLAHSHTVACVDVHIATSANYLRLSITADIALLRQHVSSAVLQLTFKHTSALNQH